MSGRHEVDLVRDHYLIGNIDGSMPGKCALVPNEYGPTNRDVQPVIRIERWDEVEGVANPLTDQILKGCTNRIWLVQVVMLSLADNLTAIFTLSNKSRNCCDSV